ncbi:MAG: hypothetical protein E7172_05280 [Firmicutes bacterium]|nr:hypothetical protein [Bacillota bacterium]
MKKLFNWIIGVAFLLIVGYFGYILFIAGEKYQSEFDRYFTLKVNDSVVIDDEVIVKLMKIEDKTAVDENGVQSGEMEFKVLVVNDMKFAYVTVGTFSNPTMQPGKLKYTLKYIEMKDDESVTFTLSRLKEKK